MAKVHVKNDGLDVEVNDGDQLNKLNGKCSILFACETGICGSCLVKVNKGMENLEAPNQAEKDGLTNFGSDPKHRLMCQCKIKKGEVEVEYG